MIAFSGAVCAMLMALLAPEDVRESREIAAWVIALAVLGTLVVGLLIGSFHAWLITVVRLPPFVATLATLVGLRSLARILMESVTRAVWDSPKTQIDIAADHFKALTREFRLPLPWVATLWTTAPWVPLFLFALLAVLAWVLMSRTVVGRHLHALGGNEQAARLSGIQTDRLKWLAYCISAVLASMAGILYVSDTTTANPQNLGRGYELNAIAAAVVGGCSLSGGVGTIPGTVLGVLFLRAVIDGVAKIIKSNAEVYEGLIVGGRRGDRRGLDAVSAGGRSRTALLRGSPGLGHRLQPRSAGRRAGPGDDSARSPSTIRNPPQSPDGGGECRRHRSPGPAAWLASSKRGAAGERSPHDAAHLDPIGHQALPGRRRPRATSPSTSTRRAARHRRRERRRQIDADEDPVRRHPRLRGGSAAARPSRSASPARATPRRPASASSTRS